MRHSGSRKYRSTHPWIRFPEDVQAPPLVWSLLGQVVARSETLARMPLPPEASRELHTLWLVKAVRASAAIGGETLSESEVRARVEGGEKPPPSRAHLGVEVDGLLDAHNNVRVALLTDEHLTLSRERLSEWNRLMLEGLEAYIAEEAIAGELRRFDITPGNYRGAPARDCRYLLDRFTEWIETDLGVGKTEDRQSLDILRGLLAHVYLVWIQPFGDGNGPTARLAEFFFLLRSGLPSPSCHLLTDHYYRTRDEYYRRLDRSTTAGFGRGDPWRFVTYALEGLVDGLKEQATAVERIQIQLAWPGFVREQVGGRQAARRERRVLLAATIAKAEAGASRSRLLRHPDLAHAYARGRGKTLTRDLNRLIDRELVEKSDAGYRARTDRLRALRPRRGAGTARGQPDS